MNFTEVEGWRYEDTFDTLLWNIDNGCAPVEVLKDGKRVAVIMSVEQYEQIKDRLTTVRVAK